MRPPTLAFGIPIDDLTMVETLDIIDELVVDGRRSGRSHQIATVNVDFLVNALNDERLRQLLQRVALNIPDGLPLVWASRLSGVALRERVAGADLVPMIAAQAARRQWRIHFFGSSPAVAERALDLLRVRHPDAHLTGDSGPRIVDPSVVDPSVLDAIAAEQPDILCVALGNPKQEWFAATYGALLGVPVTIGIGGSLDMLVGERRRAPEWVQRAGVEWIYRAAQEPRRLGRRYLNDAIKYPPRFGRYARELSQHGRGADIAVRISDDGAAQRTVVVAPSSSPLELAAYETASHQIAAGAPLRIDLGERALRPLALSAVIGLERTARRHGGVIDVVEPTPAIRRQLEQLGISPFTSDESTEPSP